MIMLRMKIIEFHEAEPKESQKKKSLACEDCELF